MQRGWHVASALGAMLLAGCGSRDAAWDSTPGAVMLGQLSDAAIFVDANLNRGLVVTARGDQSLDFSAVRLGKKIVSATTSSDRRRAFVLSQGDDVRLRATDESAALSVLEAGHPRDVARYELPDALTSLALDPAGRYAIVYAGDASSGGFIQNPNELLVVDLEAPPGAGNPARRDLPSHLGGSPKRLTFSPPLHLAGGDRRLLVVETDRDVMLIDLEHPERPDVSLPVKDRHTDARVLSPAGIAIDPGQPGASGRSPSIAIRTNADDNVIIYTLGPSGRDAPDNDFIPTPNAAVVGGVPTDIAFVNTNQGPRLVALVASPAPTGFLIKVDDNQTLSAKFGATYQQLSPVAGFAPEISTEGDQLLLWSTDGRTASIAFWDLDKVPDIPFGSIDTLKSVETINLSGPIAAVTSIPERNLKIVATTSRSLYVLDPQQHLTSALNATGSVTLRYSREGDRAWAFQPSQKQLAQIALAGAHITNVDVDQAVSDVIEIDAQGGGRALLVLHMPVTASGGERQTFGIPGQAYGVTVFDALAPRAAQSRRYGALLIEGIAEK